MSLGGQRRRADGDIVEQAESHGAVALGMVTRWSHRNKGDPIASTFECRDGFKAGPGCPPGRIERVRSSVRIWVKVTSALITESFEFGEVLGRVHPGKIFEPGLRGGDVLDLVIEVQVAYAVHDREDPALLFGVQPTAIMGACP